MGIIEASLLCLSLNIYHEARGEPIAGQIAVAQVTLNRAKQANKSICSVVYDKKQFSWTIYKPSIRDKADFTKSKEIANKVLHAKYRDYTYGSTYYHSNSVRPRWSVGIRPTVKLGKHVFYSAIPGKYAMKD